MCTNPPQGVCSTFVKIVWAQVMLLQQQLLQGKRAHPRASAVTIRSLTHFILASGQSDTLYDWTVVTLNESITLRFTSTPYESRCL